MTQDDLILIAASIGVIALMAVFVLAQALIRTWREHRALEARMDELELSLILAESLGERDAGAERAPASQRDAAASGAQQPREPMPRVVFAQQALESLASGLRREHTLCPGIEAGYALVGHVEGEGANRRIVITGLIDGGRGDDRSMGHVRFDRDYQQGRLEQLQIISPRASHMGDAHSHPGALDRCSGGDYQTDVANVRASNTQEMVFVIATEAAAHGYRSSDPASIYAAGFKMDFFYLGKASGYRYAKVRPDVDPGVGMLVFPPALIGPATRNPERFRLDWACLCRLPGVSVQVRELELEGKQCGCIELSPHDGAGMVLIVMGDSNDSRDGAAPTVFLEVGNDLVRFEPPFLAEKWTDHVWLTEVVMSAMGELRRLVSERQPQRGRSLGNGNGDGQRSFLIA